MYIEDTLPIELLDEPVQHLQYPARVSSIGRGGGSGGIGSGGIYGVENGGGGGGGICSGIGVGDGFFERKIREASRRCSEYEFSTETVKSSSSHSNRCFVDGGSKYSYGYSDGGDVNVDGSIPMGFDILAKIRKLLHFGDSAESLGRKRRADGDSNSSSQFKYRKVESEFPKIITRSLEEGMVWRPFPLQDDLNIISPRFHQVPLAMAQRKQQIQKEKKSSFLRPKTVTKHITNTAFADIEFSDDDEDEFIFTNGRGETFNVVRQPTQKRPPISRPAVISTSSPNIPFKQKQPPPPLIEARTGGILASTLMPDLQPIRPPAYSSILSAYHNGFDNAFTNSINAKRSTAKERIVPIRRTTPILFNGGYSGHSRSIISQENQTKDREQYSELLQKLAPNLYGIKGTTPKVRPPVKILPALNRSKTLPTIDLTENRTSNRKSFTVEDASAIDLSDDEVSEIIDLVNEELNVLSACSKLQKDDAECTYDLKKRAAEKKKQLPYVEPINSLKEKFDLAPVCKDDWLQNTTSKWEKKRLERKQQLAETEKEVEERSAETRFREKQMHQRLKDLQIVDPDLVVFDDFPEGDEEPEFPVLTPEHETLIKSALFSGPADQMLISKFNMSITRRDINTLLGKNWLNDEVINFYMNLLTERGEQCHSHGLPKVYAMNTFFVPKLVQSGHSGVRRWTRKVDIFSYDVIPVPVHVGGVHWCMAIIHLQGRSIKYYDSMGTPNPRILSALEQYLREESLDKRKRPFDTSDFLIESVRDVPRQMNGSDCGVFSCMFAEYISRGREITFSQQHMEYFRHKMILEIVQGKLMQ